MDSKSNPSPDDGLPSYSESVRSPQQYSPSPSHHHPPNIAAARTALITSLLTTYVTPHLFESALSGLSSSTLVLVPTNVSTLNPPPGKSGSQGPAETVVGFPSAENPTMVRLQGQENSLEFWRQPTVMQELGQQVCSHLRSSGYRIKGGSEASLQRPSPSTADWRTVQNETLGNGEVSIQVETTDICLRVENDMGLYETKTGKAVVVKVTFGG